MTAVRRIAAVLACLLAVAALGACGARGESSSSAKESSAAESSAQESGAPDSEGEGESTITIESEPNPAELLEQELQKSMDSLAREFAAVLPTGNFTRIAAVSHLSADDLSYFQNVTISAADLEPLKMPGFYRLTLTVSEPGSTLLMAGTYPYIMQVGYPDFGDGNLTVRFIANEKQYRSFEEIDADPAMRQVDYLRQISNFGEFASPQDITMPKLMDYLIIIASVDARDRGIEQYEFTQEEINTVAKKYFGFPSFVFTSANEYDAARGLYVLYGRGGNVRNERVINRVDVDGGIVEVYVETFKDPLQLLMDKIICYRLSPNDDGSFRFLSAERVKLD